MKRKTMKALSIKQPWAWAIANGLKTIETRKWCPNHRGDILIVASLKPDKLLLEWLVEQRGKEILEQVEYGKAIAIVELVDCRTMVKGDAKAAMCEPYPGAYSWFLEDARKIKPFAVTGRLGLYEVKRVGALEALPDE